MNELLIQISEAIQKGKKKQIQTLVPQAIEAGMSAQEILNDGLLHGMNIIGDKFTRNEVFVPEVLVSARAMNSGTELLKPLLAEEGAEAIGKACIGTVAGDLHDIGKNIVRMMLESKNFEVIDLGSDVPADEFIKCAVENDCKLICCSALLSTTMPVMGEVVEKANEAGIRDKVVIMIGGAPVTQSFCDKIGADAYTPDAASCAAKAVELVGKLA